MSTPHTPNTSNGGPNSWPHHFPARHMDFTVASPLTPRAAFANLTDWVAHRIPLTTISYHTPPPHGANTRFVARTAVGALGFDDNMAVTVWQPPQEPQDVGRCEVTKTGPLLFGGAVIDVTPSTEGCVVRWREAITVKARPLAPVVQVVAAQCGPLAFKPLVASLVS